MAFTPSSDPRYIAEALNKLQAQIDRPNTTLISGIADQMSRGLIPGFGSGMNDTYTSSDNTDATHPLNIRYIIPSNVQRLTRARLSFHLGPYRTYSNFSLVSTATETQDHAHATAGSTGHNHNHAHSISLGAAGGGNAVTFNSVASPQLLEGTGGTDTTSIVANAAGESGHGHGNTAGRSAVHNHAVSGTSALGVVEGAAAAGVTILFDGVDQTAAMGGPWSVDVIEIDVRPYLPTSTGVYHTIALQPTGLGRIEAHLLLGAYVDARLT